MPFNLDKNKQNFHKIKNCLIHVSKNYSLDRLDVLLILDGTVDNKGIREWYNELSNLYETFSSVLFIPISRESSEDYVRDFTVLVTGARSEDALVGTRTQSKDTIIKIYDGRVSPSLQAIDNIRYYDDLWNIFLDKLNSISYFSKFNRYEKELWFENNSKPEDIYIEDIENLKIHLLDVGNGGEGGILQIPESTVEHISNLDLPPTLLKKIIEEFPKKPGSSGIKGRHTLMFRRGIWKISILYTSVKKYKGIIIDPHEATIFKTADEDPFDEEDPFKLIVFDHIPKTYNEHASKYIVDEKQKICIMVYTNYAKLNDDTMIEVINESFQELDRPERIDSLYFSKIKGIFKDYSFTPAGYKSLLQKIIRFGPREYIVDNENKYNIVTFLVCTIACLFLSPGSFVPDIQRFVSGLESAFKRVIVTIFEDSYFIGSFSIMMLTCSVGAFLAQRLPGWRPTSYMLKCAFVLAIDGYMSRKAFVFDIARGMKLPPYTINSKSKELEIVSALLDEIKSFHGDLGLARDIANNFYKGELKTTSSEIYPMNMILGHCIDQHFTPEIAYMYNPESIRELVIQGNNPFSKLFIKIFSEVTGINPSRPPRKGVVMNISSYSKDFENREFVKLTRKAQALILLSRNIDIPSIKLKEIYPNKTFKLNYDFGKEWIAGIVGALEIKSTKKGPTALVTMNPSEPSLFIAIRKPSRDMKDPFLSDERAEEAIHSSKNILKDGIHIRGMCLPMKELKNSLFKMEYSNDEDTKFLFKLKGTQEWIEWNKIFKGSLNIPYVEDVDLSVENALSIKNNGVMYNPKQKLIEVLKFSNKEYIRKLITYLTNSSIIEFKRLGREGGGTKGIINLDDVGAYHIFLKIYLIFGYGFLRKKGNCLDFHVKNKSLVVYIKNIILKFLNESSAKSDYLEFGKIEDSKNRKLWEHQIEAIDELNSNLKQGKKGSFLWLPVGSGKTMIVLEHLKHQIENKSIPPYVVYTLPSSAIESIINEIKFYGFKYKLLVPLKNLNKSYRNSGKIKEYIKNDCTPEPYTINLIEHDHLRKCENILPEYMSNSIFIIDEVHKALNETKRTAVALQLSHLSREFIALTGTPIIDSNTYKLIWWLEQIVSFEIDKDNFWVAANSMIAKKFVTGVKIEHISKYIHLTHREEEIYKSLVPVGLGGINEHPRPSDFREAMELCYKITNRGILSETLNLIKEGRGVFIVAKDSAHQSLLKDIFSEHVSPSKIFLITATQTLFLTDDSVNKKVTPDYKIVITTVRKSAGYTLTRLSSMVTGVYPSNNADREQLEGRINRIGQSSPDIKYITVHTGILTYIKQKHIDAKNLSAVLSALAGDIKF